MPEDDRLYGLPLEQFIPARDTAARELRKAGDREAAARVAKLPKPSAAAWAANQVARTEPDLISALLDAGAALRAAQDAAMAGGGACGLRDATLAERRAVEAVMAAAAALKPGGKPLSGAMADRLRSTLHAAAGDPELRSALAAGRLVGDARAGGAWPFALGAGDDEPAEPPAPKPRVDEAAARKALQAELREARSALRVRERVAAGAQEDAEDAARTLGEARERLAEAQEALEDAQAEAEAAERALAQARAERDEVRDTVARLEERLD